MKITFLRIFHLLLHIIKIPILIFALKINKIPNQEEIISIIQNNNIIYFITLSSIGKINEYKNYQILTNFLELTHQSQIIFDNISNKFISVCTKKNLIESINLNNDNLSFTNLINMSISKKLQFHIIQIYKNIILLILHMIKIQIQIF